MLLIINIIRYIEYLASNYNVIIFLFNMFKLKELILWIVM